MYGKEDDGIGLLMIKQSWLYVCNTESTFRPKCLKRIKILLSVSCPYILICACVEEDVDRLRDFEVK